jgi:hypothetical protein
MAIPVNVAGDLQRAPDYWLRFGRTSHRAEQESQIVLVYGNRGLISHFFVESQRPKQEHLCFLEPMSFHQDKGQDIEGFCTIRVSFSGTKEDLYSLAKQRLGIVQVPHNLVVSETSQPSEKRRLATPSKIHQ